MGRLRNLSQSLKAAAFNKTNEHASASTVTSRHDNSSDEVVVKKEIPTVTRETSSTSVLADGAPAIRGIRSNSRPTSQVYIPPTMSAGIQDQIDELKPVFSFLSSHQNKLYQEGYFLKLNDLDIHGKPNADRNWTECFAQLVGTVLSLWDAAALDAAGQDGEVAPTFINLADASIKMIETLPTRNANVQPLQNVLSVSTAGKNRYLLHFNSLHSLTQWTAGIRLAMYEHASLQELYTGSLIAGKGKFLNNIKAILERQRFVEEDWARVRFGAGTPWRRCWYVIEPPDEKEWQKTQKSLKKRGAYEKAEYPKGVIKFFEKKGKKATPIATISDVYSAYAVYPQSKPLIDQSTLVKLEGKITIHSKPESVTEGFVFVMPEVHPAVSGFEMMLRFLFPVYDTFALYGRPTRLIADTLDARGLMFAMPKDRKYGYLDIIDVAGLIHTDSSERWSEREWRKKMKELVSRRMTMATQGRASNVEKSGRRSLGARPGIRYGDSDSAQSPVNQSTDNVFEAPKKTYTAPLASSSVPSQINHTRSVSESVASRSQPKQRRYGPSRLSTDQESREDIEHIRNGPSTTPPAHRHHPYKNGFVSENEVNTSTNSSDSELGPGVGAEEVTHDLLPEPTPPAPVSQPFFQHQASDMPQKRPVVRPELRREKSRMSNSTLDQLVDASKNGVGSGRALDAGAAAAAAWRANGRYESQARGVNNQIPNDREIDANPLEKAISTDSTSRRLAHNDPRTRSRIPYTRSQSDQTITRKPIPFNTRPAPPPPPPPPLLQPNPLSMFDQDLSPDYASTERSEGNQPERRKPGGIRKTIGDPNYAQQPKSDIPDIDFGFTQSLTPGNSRPGTAGGRVSPLEDRTPPTPRTPNDDRKLYPGRVSPLPSPQSRPSSQVWHPGTTIGRQSPGALTPEEFVQQRANMARFPQGYVQRRTVSSSRAEELMPPAAPPPQSPQKGKLQKKRQPPRADSQGSTPDFSSHLSAREQEHVARATGGPLLSLPDRSHTPDPNVGLVGAISAREQDRRNMKEGISSHLVQASIAQRQQQYQQQQYEQQYQQQQQSAYMSQVQAQYRPGMNAWAQQQNRHAPQGYYPQPQYPPQYPPQQFYQQPVNQQHPYAQPHHQRQQSYQNAYSNQYDGYYASQQGYQRQ